MEFKHWLRTLFPTERAAQTLAQKIEEADERIANLKDQIAAVQERRAELEREAKSFASNGFNERDITTAIAKMEVQTLDSVLSSTVNLQRELHQLFVESGPFLSELVEPELAQCGSLCQKLSRWKSICR
jgi:chromosome segregation ATPase